MQPNPDWWTAVLWKRIMGREVLNTTTSISGSGSGDVVSFMHCHTQHGVALAYINLDPVNFASLHVAGIDATPREEYHLTAVGGALREQAIALNGKPLKYADGFMSPLDPVVVSDARVPLLAAPLSYGFVVFPTAKVAACAA